MLTDKKPTFDKIQGQKKTTMQLYIISLLYDLLVLSVINMKFEFCVDILLSLTIGDDE